MKPILFNTEMVRAIQEDRKTVTRWVVKPRLPDGVRTLYPEKNGAVWRSEGTDVWVQIKPPYQPGDILWVRETWAHPSAAEIEAGADSNMYLYKADALQPAAWNKWHPSIHMPKEATRMFLRVTGVRVKRLQDITEAGAIAEGIPDDWPMNTVYCPVCKGEGLIGAHHPVSLGYMEADCPHCEKATSRFANLWNSTIKPADLPLYGWNVNPWVWVIEFERISKETALGGGGDG